MIARMDKEIESLTDRQTLEMENKIEQLDVSTTSEVITNYRISFSKHTYIISFVGHKQSTIPAIFYTKHGSAKMGVRIRGTQRTSEK